MALNLFNLYLRTYGEINSGNTSEVLLLYTSHETCLKTILVIEQTNSLVLALGQNWVFLSHH